MRLDKLLVRKTNLSNKVIREALASGKVDVNGVEGVQDGLMEVGRFCTIHLDGKPVQENQSYYILLNKPSGVVSTTADNEQRPTVITCVDEPWGSELHMVGRLDMDTTGLVLLTNDGNWSRQITLPNSKVAKTYIVETLFDEEDMDTASSQFEQGLFLEDEGITLRPATLVRISSKLFRVTLHEGRQHQVKRMFYAIGNKVVRLHREAVGHLELDESLVPSGCWRHLTDDEVSAFLVDTDEKRRN